MALILALNPGNSHSPTLSRLARELQGCELIGAESCVVAINAVKERVPDVVLLPAKPARGEADLIAHLKTVPGGVLTLKLPPVDSADPVDLARQIREMLTGVSAAAGPPEAAPLGTSPHLLAAATAAINWIRTRREGWMDQRPQEVPPAPVPLWTGVSPSAVPYEPVEQSRHYEPYEPIEPSESDPPETTDEPYAADEPHATYATQIKTWLPRVAAVAVVLGVAGAMVSYWPQIRGGVSSTEGERDAPDAASRSAQVNPEAVAPQSVVKPEAEPDPLAKTPGWVAVFSPIEVSISADGRGVQVDDRGRATLAPGKHRLRFQNRALGYDDTRTVEVRPADTTTVNLIPETAIAVTSNEPAEVLIDGTRAGDTPYDGKIGLGTHTVTVRSAGAERQLTVEATSKPVQLEVDFSKP